MEKFNLKVDIVFDHIKENDKVHSLINSNIEDFNFIGNKKEFSIKLMLDEDGDIYKTIKEWKKYRKPTRMSITYNFSNKVTETYLAILNNYDLCKEDNSITVYFNITGEE